MTRAAEIDSLRRDVEAARAAFEARPDYDALVSEARSHGFRRLDLHEQLDSGWFLANAYTWKGSVWAKMEIA